MTLSSAQSAAALLPIHTPGRHEQPLLHVGTTAAAVFDAGVPALLEMRSFVCPHCRAGFLARFAGLCDACFATAKETEIRKAGALTYLKTFPLRARNFIEAGQAGGPSIAKARTLLKLIRGNQGPLVILIGDRWTGKTVMATWCASMLGFGLYTKAFDLFAAVRKTYHADSKVREHEVLERFRRADFLVIDEAQERKESEWENSLLTNLMDKRYDGLKPTFIIANLKEEALDAALGPSIIRRATETGGIVDCNWAPYGG